VHRKSLISKSFSLLIYAPTPTKIAQRDLHPGFATYVPYGITVKNSATEHATLSLLRATRLLNQVRERIRYKHYSLRTDQAYRMS